MTKNQSRNQSWNKWAAAAQAGDKKAYNKLLHEILPFIQSVIAPSLANPVWIDDITQEVLLSVHKSLHTYSPDRAFTPWLLSIINFRKADFLRSHYSRRGNMQVDLEDAVFQNKHVTETAYAGEYKSVEIALNSLPDKQKKIFQMVKIDGYTAKEVANELNMSESAVKVSVHRTMVKLKDKFA